MTVDHGAIEPDVAAALERLGGVIAGYGPMTVAYSGGVDSGLVAYVAHDTLGDEMMCIIGVSPSLSPREERDAIAFLEEHGIPFARIETHEIDDARYRANAPDRCFFCKTELFERIETASEAARFPRIAYGANTDDRFDHRPGARAADGHGVVAPLVDAGFDKELVRRTARALGLSLWDKPAAPCLASRIPHFTEVTPEKLRQVDVAEGVLRDLGFRVCRVRHYGDTARIELPLEDHARVRAGATWKIVVNGITAAGFKRVQLEPEGFRSGRLSEAYRTDDDRRSG
jgi:uncharacterized protein